MVKRLPFASRRRALSACLVLLLGLFQAAAALAAPVAGYVKDLKGGVWAVQAGQRRSLGDMSPVFVADEIESAADGGAKILMVDESSVFLGPGSKLVVADMGFVEVDGKVAQNTSMSVKAVSGAFRFVTGKVAKANPDNFKVETPMGLIGVRGTDISSQVQGDVERHRLNGGGPMFVGDLSGNFQTISQPGFGVELRPGQPVGPPQPMSLSQLSLGGGPVTLAQLTGPGGPGGPGPGQGMPLPPPPATDLPGAYGANQALLGAYQRYGLARNMDFLNFLLSLHSGPNGTRWYLGSTPITEGGPLKPFIATNEPYVTTQFLAFDTSNEPFFQFQLRLPGQINPNLASAYGLAMGQATNGLSYTGFGCDTSLTGTSLYAAGQAYYRDLAQSLRQAGLSAQAAAYEAQAASFDPRTFTGLSNLWVYGVPTVSDLPTTGTGVYTGSTVGRWAFAPYFTVSNQGYFGGSVNVSVDFARDLVTNFTVNITGCPYVTQLTGNGNITRYTNAGILEYGFNGQINAATGTVSHTAGSFLGRFHGPAGQEIGGSYNWKGVNAGTNIIYLNGVFGAAR